MRKLIAFAILFFVQLSIAQTVDFNKIKFKGLSFYSSQNEIIKKLGKPKKIYKPNYECGFLSNGEQDEIYFTLDYGRIKFTGSKAEKFVLEKINFENDNSIVLNYKQFRLSYKTTFNDLLEIFGKKIIKLIGTDLNGRFTIMHEKNDDGIIIELKKGRLIQIEYWSPC